MNATQIIENNSYFPVWNVKISMQVSEFAVTTKLTDN